MKIEHYSTPWKADVICLIEKFHVHFLQGFDKEINAKNVDQTIQLFEGENADKAFLLIDGDRCVGLISGLELKSYLNDSRIYSEIFWFVDEPYGRYIHWFINKVEKMLKDQGFSKIVMGVINSDKSERIVKMYEFSGYKYLESFYVKSL
jgi:hypothetical protein